MKPAYVDLQNRLVLQAINIGCCIQNEVGLKYVLHSEIVQYYKLNLIWRW